MVTSSQICHHMAVASLEQCEPCLGLGRRVAQRLPSVMSVWLPLASEVWGIQILGFWEQD